MESGKFILTKAERQLIELVRSLSYGEIRILVKDSKPIRVEEIIRSIQLPQTENNSEFERGTYAQTNKK